MCAVKEDRVVLVKRCSVLGTVESRPGRLSIVNGTSKITFRMSYRRIHNTSSPVNCFLCSIRIVNKVLKALELSNYPPNYCGLRNLYKQLHGFFFKVTELINLKRNRAAACGDWNQWWVLYNLKTPKVIMNATIIAMHDIVCFWRRENNN